ncbi:phospholipase D-like domain-containing protein [Ornithinimicrobium avium]|uniref:Phosphatidylserine/phosphatidylglycerophosphate/ cardiolipin synthase family protein n=1 Tax=Ornithinimicrobium avium TaxID=2283195 RepID=A0A345NRM1_9MICO|nr:phospholipase D-like domain-containing protein [Ornithinimicrobium avium]AXH97679.1 phosphatidylserine/phosphatidylglycerophosphate/cardiolipin synthase family protein [Ornithinimicrobium avium]
MPRPVLAPHARDWLKDARRIAVRTLAWGVAGQVSLAAAVVAADSLRKRRDGTAPADEPVEVPVREDRITTYTYGRALYDDMLAAIERAEDFVYLASYIWKGDDVGQEFKDAVVRAADRGVLVCVVFDGFANLVVPRAFTEFPEQVHVLRFPTIRPGLPLMDLRRTGRDHRKILVVDGRVGFVGGYNIGSLYATSWRDTHVRIEGPGVWELQNAFSDFWNRHRNKGHPALEDSGNPRWNTVVLAARNEPSRLVYPVRSLYLEAIDRSMKNVWITQGYFIPDQEILEGLLAVAARGVDVRVIMPERSNHVLADVVARYYWSALLEGGVRIFLYKDVMVHAKTATVDGAWSTIGTANIDRLSLRGNYEINLEVVDADQAATMEEIFRRDLQNCEEITLERWRARPWYYRVLERSLRPLEAML